MTRAVTLVAPVAPFRGGIAQHSTALAASLARQQEACTRVRSFRRLYPRLLYPGASDRDPELIGGSIPGSSYSLDTLNPLTWNVEVSKGDVVVIPAWTFFVAPMLGTIARKARKRGAAVVLIVHNAADHESAAWKSRLMSWQFEAASAFVVHTHDQARQLREAGFGQPIAVAPHPPYDDFPEAKGLLPRERALELLCFGLVRRYKGVDIALRALAAVERQDVRLTIVGEVWEDRLTLQALLEDPRLHGKVDFIDRYVSAAEAAEYFARSDVVLAPYRAVTGSGVLALAHHYRRPVAASDLPGFAEVIDHGVSGWLFPPEDEKALSVLLSGLSRSAAEALQARRGTNMVCRGWDAYAATVLDLVARLDARLGSRG